MGRTWPRALLGVCLAVALTACASLRYGGAAALKIESNVNDAAVYIDDQYVGRVSQWEEDGNFVKPGYHRVEIRHPDHYTVYRDVTLTTGDAVLLQTKLHRLLD